jgi:hypothetical protein
LNEPIKEPVINLTFNQIKDIIAELKKPNPLEAEKIEKEQQLRQRAKEEKIEQVRLDAEMKRQREEGCSHRKQNGESTIMGQIHSDGMRHSVCFRCQKEFPPQKVSMQEMVLGG